jgi:hypothetical protein
VKTQPELTEFDELLDGLGALTRVELEASRIPARVPGDVEVIAVDLGSLRARPAAQARAGPPSG